MFYVHVIDDQDYIPFDTYREAEAFAMENAEDGYSCEILEYRCFFEGKRVDLCEQNGVRPGIDFPASL